jgi:hypothetical protein
LLVTFGTPLRLLWANASAPWWLPYFLWACGIAGIRAAVRSREAELRRHAGDAGQDP